MVGRYELVLGGSPVYRQFYNCSTNKYEEDGSLTCNNFLASTPCCLTLSLYGGAKEVQGKCEGVYKSTGLVSMGREVREI